MNKWINTPDTSSNSCLIEIRLYNVKEVAFRDALRETAKRFDSVLGELCDCCNSRLGRWWRHFWEMKNE